MSQVAWLFPGQGAQSVGMGRELYQEFAAVRALYDRASALLGFNLATKCFEGPPEELTRTDIAQPALLTTSMAVLEAAKPLLSDRWAPKAMAGLSLGEYTALAAAGALTVDDGIKLVWARGQFMEEAAKLEQGTMASILGFGVEPLREICRKTGAELANLNSPDQLVISGPKAAVLEAAAQAKAAGAKRAIELTVSGAFHSRLMQPAADKLTAVLAATPMQVPSTLVVSNVTAQPHPAQPDAIRAALAQQLTSPVRWEDSMRYLLGLGIRTFLELGSGTVLKGLMRKIEPAAEVISIGSVKDLHALDAKVGEAS